MMLLPEFADAFLALETLRFGGATLRSRIPPRKVGIGHFPFADMQAMSSASAIQWSHLAVLGAVHTCLTYILMHSAFQKLSTVMIAVLSFIYPAVAIVVDYVVYDVSLRGLQFAGAFLILFGGFAVSQNLPILSRVRMRRSGSRSAEAAQDGIE